MYKYDVQCMSTYIDILLYLIPLHFKLHVHSSLLILFLILLMYIVHIYRHNLYITIAKTQLDDQCGAIWIVTYSMYMCKMQFDYFLACVMDDLLWHSMMTSEVMGESMTNHCLITLVYDSWPWTWWWWTSPFTELILFFLVCMHGQLKTGVPGEIKVASFFDDWTCEVCLLLTINHWNQRQACFSKQCPVY